MNDSIERSVTINHDQELYVIKSGDGFTALGFDVCLERIALYGIELAGYGVIPEQHIDTPIVTARGSIESYDTMVNLQQLLIKTVEERGTQAACMLSPQLIGLEGRRVEVTDKHGETRRFNVGRSTGPIPIHLEVARRDSSGGVGASREYESVRVIR